MRGSWYCCAPVQVRHRRTTVRPEMEETMQNPYTTDTKITDVINDPIFGGYGRLIFPTNEGYYSGDTLGQLRLTWYSNIDPAKTVEITSYMKTHAEAGKAVSDYLGNGKNIVYINVMNRISIDCDCDSNPSEPDLHDIGILASADPVALDQACIDLVYAQRDGDGASLVNRIESRDGLHTLEHAEEIGLDSRTYTH